MLFLKATEKWICIPPEHLYSEANSADTEENTTTMWLRQGKNLVYLAATATYNNLKKEKFTELHQIHQLKAIQQRKTWSDEEDDDDVSVTQTWQYPNFLLVDCSYGTKSAQDVEEHGAKDKEETKPTNRKATSEQPGFAMAPYGTAGNSHGTAMTWPHQRPCFFADTISRLLNN